MEFLADCPATLSHRRMKNHSVVGIVWSQAADRSSRDRSYAVIGWLAVAVWGGPSRQRGHPGRDRSRLLERWQCAAAGPFAPAVFSRPAQSAGCHGGVSPAAVRRWSAHNSTIAGSPPPTTSNASMLSSTRRNTTASFCLLFTWGHCTT